jgi:alkanesulfonate monooxygenase SsuD/methylene tetrahydromethanopterin reductase-like flavin-dependent oxidoreductase (luciferase family)
VRFSVTLGAVGDRHPAALARLAALAEDSGWDAIFLEDYVDYQGTGAPTWDVWVCLSAIAGATSRITLGPTVTPVPRRRVWELAAQATAVDHLSNGRLVLGVGAGDLGDPGCALAGAPADASGLAHSLDAGLEALIGLWSGSETSVDGGRLTLAATPLQKPRISIWIGGDLRRPGVRRRLTRWDGACVYRERPLNPDDIHDIAELVRAARGDISGFDIKASGSPGLTKDFAAAGATWWGRWIPPGDITAAEAAIKAGPPG